MTEENGNDSKLLDSSIWLGYFLEGDFSEIVEGDSVLYLSVLSLFEVQRKLYKSSLNKEDIEKGVQFMKEKSILLEVSEEIVNVALKVANEKNVPSMDSIIYSTGVVNSIKVYTKDNDFRGLPNAVVLSV
ncbi:MAG: PIN domain-containing protein [Nanoarchaeota archaeon]